MIAVMICMRPHHTASPRSYTQGHTQTTMNHTIITPESYNVSRTRPQKSMKPITNTIMDFQLQADSGSHTYSNSILFAKHAYSCLETLEVLRCCLALGLWGKDFAHGSLHFVTSFLPASKLVLLPLRKGESKSSRRCWICWRNSLRFVWGRMLMWLASDKCPNHLLAGYNRPVSYCSQVLCETQGVPCGQAGRSAETWTLLEPWETCCWKVQASEGEGPDWRKGLQLATIPWISSHAMNHLFSALHDRDSCIFVGLSKGPWLDCTVCSSPVLIATWHSVRFALFWWWSKANLLTSEFFYGLQWSSYSTTHVHVSHVAEGCRPTFTQVVAKRKREELIADLKGRGPSQQSWLIQWCAIYSYIL